MGVYIAVGENKDIAHYINKMHKQYDNDNKSQAQKDAERAEAIDAAVEASKTDGDTGNPTICNLPVVVEKPKLPTAQEMIEMRRAAAPTTRGYNYNDATEEDIKAGYSLDGKSKWWPNHVYGKRPVKENYIHQNTQFKYNWWRRIEDTRRVYSVDGILISTGKRYKFELNKFPEVERDQLEACDQLLDAMIEYGNICPLPFDERFIETESVEVYEAQTIIQEFYEFFETNKILDFKDEPYRKQVYEFVKHFEDKFMALDVLNTYYKKNIFTCEKDIRFMKKKILKASGK